MNRRRALQGNGMNQILTHLANRCDQAWEGFPGKEGNSHGRVNYLKTLFADRDMASLLGDFAFTVLPKITSGSDLKDAVLKNIIDQLENLIWRLEDAILECDPNEEFLIRFLTEKFN
jgi:hypothetical protein